MNENHIKGGDYMNLKNIRERKNVTQNYLANRLEVDQSTISKWEKEVCSPNIQTLKKIAQVLNCTVDDLIKETG